MLSHSAAETHKIGIRLAANLSVPGVVLLRGSLGSGKTTLARGIAEGLGLNDPSLVTSPSFSLINIYQGRCRIYHIDLYRLEGARDIHSTGIDDFLGGEGITLVEWSERLTFGVEDAIRVELNDAGGDARSIRICYPASMRKARGRNSRRKKSAGRRPAMCQEPIMR